MKLFALAVLVLALPLIGCSSGSSPAEAPVDPNVNLSAKEKIDKIEKDPNIPDGLKKIQTDTLRRDPGAMR